MGFISADTPVNELPLLIEFEAKSIGKKFPAAKANLEARGYIVTPFGQDGFAMLRGDMLFKRSRGAENAVQDAVVDSVDASAEV